MVVTVSAPSAELHAVAVRMLEQNRTRDLAEIVHQLTGAEFHRRDHLDALVERLSDALDRVLRGQQVRMVVSMPPGQGKSVTASIALPLYVLSRRPDWGVGCISAEASLATKFSRDARRAAPELGIQLAEDVNAVTEWETTAGGGIIARGVNGALTGRRLRVLIMDDPVKDARHAYSELEREQLREWYTKVAKTRMAPASLQLCVMTRWHEDDLAATLLAQGWEEFRLPALAEDDDPIGRDVGAPLLDPQRVETVDEAVERWQAIREDVGSHTWAGLYQQRPAPAGGSIFQPEWLPVVTGPLDLDNGTWVTSWDLTFGSKKDRGDYVVGTVWQSCTDGTYVLHDLVRGRWEFTEQLAQVRRLAQRYPQCSRHLIEDAANGRAAVDVLKRDMNGVTPVKPQGGKVERAMAITPLMEAGKVSCVGGAWLDCLIDELVVMPNGQHDDQVDSLSQALNWLRVRRAGPPRVGKIAKATLPGW